MSAQRCVLEAQVYSKKYSEAVASFVEEIVVRRELSDNFCHYQPKYDSLQGCAQWAQDSLQLHASDKRPYVYSLQQVFVVLSYTLHPTPCTLHPAPYTLHPTPCTLHPRPCTLDPRLQTPDPRP